MRTILEIQSQIQKWGVVWNEKIKWKTKKQSIFEALALSLGTIDRSAGIKCEPIAP
jgi:hypothetical protein